MNYSFPVVFYMFQVSETCLKAYIHKGRALAGLHRYEEALDCFKQAVEVEPSKEKAIMGNSFLLSIHTVNALI